MRYSNYLLGAAVAGLVAAAATAAALAQAGGAARFDADGIERLARAQGLTDPDAIAQLRANAGLGLSGIEQRGCVSSDKVYGQNFIEVDQYKFGGCLARGADKNLDALRVLIKAAQATGHFRNNAYGFAGGYNQWLVLGDTSANWSTAGSGTWKGEQVKIRYDFDYRVPGARLYITRANGNTDIYVATDPRVKPTGRTGYLEQPEVFADGPLQGVQLAAWKEKTPGVYAGPSDMTPQEIMVLMYLHPAAVILEGRDSAATFKATRVGRNDVLTIPVPALGTDLVATLDAAGRPARTEIKLGGKTYTGEFRDFLNDRMDMEVLGPHTLSYKVDGQPLADWSLEYHHIGPYLVFPVPTEVAARR
jgi:hypothetical protein